VSKFCDGSGTGDWYPVDVRSERFTSGPRTYCKLCGRRVKVLDDGTMADHMTPRRASVPSEDTER
jgi:hypothetical protein